MPSALRNHQHELTDLAGTSSSGIVFGTDDTGLLTLTRPTVSGGELRVSDTNRPQEDGVAFGRDYRGAKTFNFEMGAITDDVNHLADTGREAANLDLLNRAEALWTHRKWRNDPLAMAMLRTCEAGRTSRCYGRPRRWEEAASAMTAEGYTPIVADFALIDDRWYSDTESSAQVTIIPSSEGGFYAPLIAPITTIASTEAKSTMVVGGYCSTWPVVEFKGPVVNPEVKIGDIVIGLDVGLAPGEVATIDPRPWRRRALRSTNDESLAGRLSSDTPAMRFMRVEPGTYPLAFRGRDTTGTATCTVRWRDARTRP